MNSESMSRRCSGFTLIEVLVAVAITASVAVIAYSSLNSALIARDRLIAEEKNLRGLQRFFNLIGRDIRHMVSRPVIDEFGEQHAALLAEDENLFNMALTRSGWDNFNALPRSNMQRVTWWLEGDVVHRAYYAVLDRASDIPPIDVAVLEGVDEIEIRYLRSSNEEQENAWQPVWPGPGIRAGQLPRAIEVSIETKELGRATRLFVSTSAN